MALSTARASARGYQAGVRRVAPSAPPSAPSFAPASALPPEARVSSMPAGSRAASEAQLTLGPACNAPASSTARWHSERIVRLYARPVGLQSKARRTARSPTRRVVAARSWGVSHVGSDATCGEGRVPRCGEHWHARRVLGREPRRQRCDLFWRQAQREALIREDVFEGHEDRWLGEQGHAAGEDRFGKARAPTVARSGEAVVGGAHLRWREIGGGPMRSDELMCPRRRVGDGRGEGWGGGGEGKGERGRGLVPRL